MIVKARWARCVAGLAALALVAAACGGDNDETAGEVAEQVATQQTSAPADTAAPTTAPATTAPELPADAVELLTQAFENSANRSVRGEMQMDMGELVSMSMNFESDGDQNFSMTMNLDDIMGGEDLGFRMEMRFVDNVGYVRYVVPDSLRELIGDGLPEGWFFLDTESAAAMGVVCPSALPGGTPDDGACRMPNDNTNQIEFLTNAEIIGKEFIDGESTTHIRYALDYGAMTEDYLTEPSEDSLSFIGDMYGGEIVFDAWIDRESLTRRMSIDMGPLLEDVIADIDESEIEGHEEEFAGLFDIANVIDFYDYDADITVEAPPEDEIVGDFGELMASLPDAN